MSKPIRNFAALLAIGAMMLALCGFAFGVAPAWANEHVSAAGNPGIATQADDDIASGTSGTCTWAIDAEGNLVVKPVTGDAGELGSWTESDGAPWYSWRTKIQSVRFEGSVKPQTCINMFYGCSSLASLDLSSLDTSGVTDMESMFRGCSSLTSLDLSSFDTAGATRTSSMFHGCSSLATLDLSSFDTSNVTEMSNMFDSCSSLVTLDLSSFDTSGVTYIPSMFHDCTSLTSLDLSSFDTSNVTYMNWLFSGCSSLVTVYVGDSWSTAQAGTAIRVFEGCTSIVGGNGTVFNSSKTGAEYARVDAIGSPGYLTYKSGDQQPLSLDAAEVSVAAGVVYTGNPCKPKPKVSIDGQALAEGEDYELSYANNVNVGTATITVRGKGNYIGAKTATFKITQAPNKATAKKTSLKKSLKAKSLKKKAATVALPAVTTAFGKASWKVTAKDKKKVLSLKSGKVRVKKGAKKGAYTIKLKATVKATKNYSAASTKVVKVKVTVK